MAVRDISASTSASYHMLSAPEAPAPTAMQSRLTAARDRMQAARRDDEAGQRGEDHERHHPRLQERDEILRPGWLTREARFAAVLSSTRDKANSG